MEMKVVMSYLGQAAHVHDVTSHDLWFQAPSLHKLCEFRVEDLTIICQAHDYVLRNDPKSISLRLRRNKLVSEKFLVKIVQQTLPGAISR